MAIDFRGVTPLLQVFDMPTALRFYRDVLGFEVFDKSGPGDECGWAWLRYHTTELMLNTAYDQGERPSAPDPTRVAAHCDTCLYFGCENLDDAYQHLLTRGVKAQPPKVAPYGMKQLYVSDPDGYGLCFQWPETQQVSDAWAKAYAVKRTPSQ